MIRYSPNLYVNIKILNISLKFNFIMYNLINKNYIKNSVFGGNKRYYSSARKISSKSVYTQITCSCFKSR